MDLDRLISNLIEEYGHTTLTAQVVDALRAQERTIKAADRMRDVILKAVPATGGVASSASRERELLAAAVAYREGKDGSGDPTHAFRFKEDVSDDEAVEAMNTMAEVLGWEEGDYLWTFNKFNMVVGLTCTDAVATHEGFKTYAEGYLEPLDSPCQYCP